MTKKMTVVYILKIMENELGLSIVTKDDQLMERDYNVQKLFPNRNTYVKMLLEDKSLLQKILKTPTIHKFIYFYFIYCPHFSLGLKTAYAL